jgi:hypothetical protein
MVPAHPVPPGIEILNIRLSFVSGPLLSTIYEGLSTTKPNIWQRRAGFDKVAENWDVEVTRR